LDTSPYTLLGPDGTKFHCQIWQAAVSAKQAGPTIVLVHGLGEHSGRYGELISHLIHRGHPVIATDLRGHGRSGGKRGHAPGYGALMDDIDLLLGAARERFPGTRFVLYGHSLGGALVINYVLRKHPDLFGVIATSPALRPAFAPPQWKLRAARALYRVWPSLTLKSELAVAAISRDQAVVRACRADKLVHDRISVRLGIDVLEAGEWALQQAAELTMPMLLMHGDSDHLTSLTASREFARRAPSCTLRVWEGLYHELHHEPEKAAVFAAISTWLEALPGARA
jgi:acylglycerol lipase